MAKKTYKTYRLKSLSLYLVNEEGERQEVVFRGGLHIDSTAKFSTSDESLQKLVESCRGFGRDYYLESVQEAKKADVVESAKAKIASAEDKPEKKPLTDVKDIRRFKNLIEMKNAMEEVGIAVSPEMNYMAAKAAAQKEGYDFQIQR